MTNTDTEDEEATLKQIQRLAGAGCEIVRVAVPNENAAAKLAEIVSRSPVPVVADIHYDPKLALKSLEAGIHKLRLNPGNITDENKIQEIAVRAKEKGVPIRVGVNGGSLEDSQIRRAGGNLSTAMVESAKQEVALLQEAGFSDIVVSLKASDVNTTVEANRQFAKEFDYPIHLGVTEAGGGRQGIVKSALGIGGLLMSGIGDTIRVSLTGDPLKEVATAYDILRSLGLRNRGLDLISCPTCGRTEINIAFIAGEIQERLSDLRNPVRLAVMGCGVNGIGEASEADVGLVGTPKGGLLYYEGKQKEALVTKNEKELVDRLEDAVREYVRGDRNMEECMNGN